MEPLILWFVCCRFTCAGKITTVSCAGNRLCSLNFHFENVILGRPVGFQKLARACHPHWSARQRLALRVAWWVASTSAPVTGQVYLQKKMYLFPNPSPCFVECYFSSQSIILSALHLNTNPFTLLSVLNFWSASPSEWTPTSIQGLAVTAYLKQRKYLCE